MRHSLKVMPHFFVYSRQVKEIYWLTRLLVGQFNNLLYLHYGK